MNHSLKKTISAIVAFIVSASCFSNMAFADTSLTIESTNAENGKISSITVGGSSTTTGKGIVAVYSKTGYLKEIAFTKENVTDATSYDLTKELNYSEADGDTYKVFVWEVDKDGKISAKPLANVFKPTPAATSTPETKPSASPDATPVVSPEESPATSPETKPSASPDATPVVSPEESPAASPETKPSASPDATPVVSPEESPAASPETTPVADVKEAVVKSTYLNFQNDTVANESYVGQTPILVGAVKLVDGKLIATNTAYADTSIGMIFSIDASDYAFKIKNAKLKFNAYTQGGYNTYFQYAGKYENYIDFDNLGNAGITANNLETLGGKATQIFDTGNNSWTYGTKKNENTPIEIDITDALKADPDGKMTMYLATGTGRLTEVTDLKVEVEAAETNQYHIINVTAPEATDGTLTVDKNTAVKDDVVTITAVPVAGKKLVAVKVNGNAITASDDKYTYTVTGEEDSIINVTAEFTNADAATIEVSGNEKAAVGTNTTVYTATPKDKDGNVLSTAVTWSVSGAAKDTTTIAQDGTLTVAEDETAESIEVIATIGEVQGKKTVQISRESVYNITKGAEDAAKGTFTISTDSATASDTVTVTPTVVAGYRVKEVSYITAAEGAEKVVVNADSEGAYKITGLSADVTVNVEFEAIPYDITSQITEGNTVAFKVGENTVTQANVGDSVSIVINRVNRHYVKSLSVVPADENSNLVIPVTNNTFTMPAEAVKVIIEIAPIAADGTLYERGVATPWTEDDKAVWGATELTADYGLHQSGGNSANSAKMSVDLDKNSVINIEAEWLGMSNTGRAFTDGNASYFNFAGVWIAENDQDKASAYSLDNGATFTTFKGDSTWANRAYDVSAKNFYVIKMQIDTETNILKYLTVASSSDPNTILLTLENKPLTNPDYSKIEFGYKRNKSVATTNNEYLKSIKVFYGEKSYSVSGTVDANVASVKLLDSNNAEVATGIIDKAANTVTFNNISNGEYKVSATTANGYKITSNSTTTVTVANDNVTNLDIKSELITYAVSGKVDAGIESVKLVKGSSEYTGTISETATDGKYDVTFGNLPIGDYLIVYTVKDGYTIKDEYVSSEDNAKLKVAVTNAAVTNVELGTNKLYNITTATVDSANGAVRVDKTTALSGTTVTITTTPAGGKVVDSVTVTKPDGTAIDGMNVTTVEADKYTFTMPAEDVKVNVTFKEAPVATIEISGGVTALKQGTTADTPFKATVKDAKGYEFTDKDVTWKVTYQSSEEPVKAGTVVSADGKLTIAADEAENKILVVKAKIGSVESNAIEVTVTAETMYNVTKHNKVNLDTLSYKEGATVSFTLAAADKGYANPSVSYTYIENENPITAPLTPTDGTYTFAMPAAAATINVEYTPIEYTVEAAEIADTEGTIAITPAAEGKSTFNVTKDIVITITPADSKLVKTTTEGKAVLNYEFADIATLEENNPKTIEATPLTGEGNENKYSFSLKDIDLPENESAQKIVITPVFDDKKYAINTQAQESVIGGSYTVTVDGADATKAIKDTEVTINTTPIIVDDKEHVVKSVTVTNKTTKETVDVTTVKENETYTFTMPNADVDVEVVFTEIWKYYQSAFADYSDRLTGDTTEEILIAMGNNNTVDPVSFDNDALTFSVGSRNGGDANVSSVRYIKTGDTYALKVGESGYSGANRGIKIKLNNAPETKTHKYLVYDMDLSMDSNIIFTIDNGTTAVTPQISARTTGGTNGIKANNKTNLKLILSGTKGYLIVTDSDNKTYITSIDTTETLVNTLNFQIASTTNSSMNIYNMSLYETDEDILQSVELTITNTVTEGEASSVVGATVTVDGAYSETTNSDGKVNFMLPVGSHTFTVNSADYKIVNDGTIDVSVGGENSKTVALADRVATKVVITSPESTIVSTSSSQKFTATVYDQDNRAMDADVEWSIVDSPANISAAEDGTVSVTDGVIAGNYKVKATIKGTEIAETADFSVSTAAPATVKVVYTTDGANEGKVKTVEATEITNKFAGDEITLADSYKNLVKGDPDENTGRFKLYTYKSGDLSKTLEAGENIIYLTVETDDVEYYYYEDYANKIADWKSGNTDRYTVSAETGALVISSVSNGNNGTTNTSTMPKLDTDKDYVMEFDLALNQCSDTTKGGSTFTINAGESGKIALSMQQTKGGASTWVVNTDAAESTVTLTSGESYHYKVESVEGGVKVTITDKEGNPILNGVTYLTTEFPTVSNSGLNGASHATSRYYAGLTLDNVKIYAPTAV